MASITYFQRYNQKENWITNSTLLLLSRLQRFDQFKFQKFLEAIFREQAEISIGVKFDQQIKGIGSIADGVLEQQGFRVVVETKLYDNFNARQLKEHASLFNTYHGTSVLLALSANTINKKKHEEIVALLHKINPKIKFVSISYKGLTDAIKGVLSDTDFEMLDIVLDYTALCQEAGFMSLKEETMLIVTAGWSLLENLKYNIYYDPADRTHSLPFQYIGLYNEKAIRAVGKLLHEVVCEYTNNKLINIEGLEKLDKSEKTRIQEVIINTGYYDLSKNTRFFIVDKFYETLAPKRKGSVRGKQYLFLNDQFEEYKNGMSGLEVAEILNNKNWD